MKIAIVAPNPVPFGIGGAENLWWGLLHEINQHTSHKADLIKLPSREAGLWELISSYKQFFYLDLSHFDLVISGKYPAWMVQHKEHTCYMLHRLRGLYDTYQFMGLPDVCETQHTEVLGFLKFIRRTTPTAQILPELFARLDILGADSSISEDIFKFPGAFSKEVIHFLDDAGLAQNAVKKYAAISSTVAKRQDYFPPSARVDVIYPPSNLRGFYCGSDEYFFTVSRLDGPKRIAMLIEAMQLVESNIKLKIAGTGPDEDALMRLANGNPRIEFLGFVNDCEVIDLYANALAVPYIPYDEDYGLVTIEAMMSEKPVLTVSDSGGPTEFVRNGENGFCVSPTIDALAERLDFLCNHRSECRQMGRNGKKMVSDITWENTVSSLLGETKNHKAYSFSPSRKKKLTVAVSFPIYPPYGGGQSRIYHLYRHLAKWWQIDIVSFAGVQDAPFEGEIAPGLKEIRIPKSQEHELQEQRLSKAVGWIPVTDIAMPRLHSLTPAYANALRKSINDSDAVIASHPYLAGALFEVAGGMPLWFEAQDVEIDLKTQMLGNSSTAIKLLSEIRKAEAECWKRAAVTYACSTADLDRLRELYGSPNGLLIEVPNGVSLEDVPFTSLSDRKTLKEKLRLSDAKVAIFMGSWHPPNIEAIENILRFAQELSDVYFLIVGSGGLAFNNRSLPNNVGITEVVDDEMKSVILSVADVALNPMLSGSGTNLKMLDYFAAGIPVISTPFGARGLGCEHGRELLLSDINEFIPSIRNVFLNTDDVLNQIIAHARHIAIEKYDWEKIARNLHEVVHWDLRGAWQVAQ
jgi:glycosyltransferase involved in cell wall biosynthesis